MVHRRLQVARSQFTLGRPCYCPRLQTHPCSHIHNRRWLTSRGIRHALLDERTRSHEFDPAGCLPAVGVDRVRDRQRCHLAAIWPGRPRTAGWALLAAPAPHCTSARAVALGERCRQAMTPQYVLQHQPPCDQFFQGLRTTSSSGRVCGAVCHARTRVVALIHGRHETQDRMALDFARCALVLWCCGVTVRRDGHNIWRFPSRRETVFCQSSSIQPQESRQCGPLKVCDHRKYLWAGLRLVSDTLAESGQCGPCFTFSLLSDEGPRWLSRRARVLSEYGYDGGECSGGVVSQSW